MKRGIISTICLLSFCVLPAKASLVTIQITSEITEVSDTAGLLRGQIDIGDIIAGTYTYNSATLDSSPATRIGRYEHNVNPYGMFLRSESGVEFQSDPYKIAFLIEIINDNIGYGGDRYLAWSQRNIPLREGVFIYSIWCEFFDPTYTALSDDSLPLSPPVLTDWERHFLQIDGHTLGPADRILDRFQIIATVISVQPVPEPATVLLIGFGALILTRKTLTRK